MNGNYSKTVIGAMLRSAGVAEENVPSIFRNGFQGLQRIESENDKYCNKKLSSEYYYGTHQLKVTLKLLSSGEEFPMRTLSVPCHIGRTIDRNSRPTNRNGLFCSPYLSRHHAVIRSDTIGRICIEDLGSSNGTFVNGICLKVGEAWPLADGDLIQFGSEDDDANTIVAQVFFDDSAHQIEEDPFLKPVRGDELSQKIADISRSIASVGLALKTHTLSKDEHGSAREILASIEGLLRDLQSVNLGTNTSHTIFERPSLREALRIISTYELVFCLIALSMVFVLSW